jgi:hypothetical protein
VRESVPGADIVRVAAEGLGVESFQHSHGAGIEAALQHAKTAANTVGGGGGVAAAATAAERECCAALVDGEAGIVWLLDELERLRAELLGCVRREGDAVAPGGAGGGDGGGGDFVLTHQEPHLANFCAVQVLTITSVG